MSADDYVLGILAREQVDNSLSSPVLAAKQTLMPVLSKWGGSYLQQVHPNGSFAKGTANRSGTDIDLFISLSPTTPDSLKQIYETLFVAVSRAGYTPRRQNVSIGLRVNGVDVDLVPGKQQNIHFLDHSLYRRKADSWTKTNVQTHIVHVLAGGRQLETRVAKLWRNQLGLDFPSFYLELAVIEALRTNLSLGLSNRVWSVFQYLAGGFSTARFVDPANTNNVISDDLTVAEKSAIKAAAARTLQAKTWGEVVR
ncbi:nucleotidyltransferase domain-containing protein [Pseudoxanthomonas winnipegensis]|uniref:nucleotidyltransferase domain-containing protein n=1 Tax=Pseudoxanthomonas winnipegensis TaxID=2480810 RepID=UPI0030F479A7